MYNIQVELYCVGINLDINYSCNFEMMTLPPDGTIKKSPIYDPVACNGLISKFIPTQYNSTCMLYIERRGIHEVEHCTLDAHLRNYI